MVAQGPVTQDVHEAYFTFQQNFLRGDQCDWKFDTAESALT